MHWTTVPIRVPEQPVLSIEEISALVGVDKRTVRRWVVEGKFPLPKTIGNKKQWTSMAFGAWLLWQDFKPEVNAGDSEEQEDSQETMAKPSRRSNQGREQV
ncbi:MAG: helix-turn-helix domain-containing protein [Bacteroidales bacterium]|nr:helix-turn-helix domain-containing protein [Bacteroidales bacterium]